MLKPKKRTLKAIRPNVGVEVAYRTALIDILSDMQADLLIGLRTELTPRTMAQDMSVPTFLKEFFGQWSNKWRKNIEAISPKLIEKFVGQSVEHTDQAFKSALKKAGFTVNFKMTEKVSENVQATIGENVSLINSWANGYFDEIQQDVWESIRVGHDLQTLTENLQNRYGIAKRKADFIARDQNNKAKATIEKTRRLELGITQAIWQHSHAGRKPRPSHVKADGKTFDIEKGMYLDGKWVQPAEEYNCRCTSRAIIEGF